MKYIFQKDKTFLCIYASGDACEPEAEILIYMAI